VGFSVPDDDMRTIPDDELEFNARVRHSYVYV